MVEDVFFGHLRGEPGLFSVGEGWQWQRRRKIMRSMGETSDEVKTCATCTAAGGLPWKELGSVSGCGSNSAACC